MATPIAAKAAIVRWAIGARAISTVGAPAAIRSSSGIRSANVATRAYAVLGWPCRAAIIEGPTRALVAARKEGLRRRLRVLTRRLLQG